MKPPLCLAGFSAILVMAVGSITAPAGITINDPLYQQGYQWNLNNTGTGPTCPGAVAGEDINVLPAWNMSDGTNLISGLGVNIAIVDTGVNYTHEDFDRLRTDLALGWEESGGLWQEVNDADTDDNEYPHGTEVAGTAAANGLNGQGIMGVAHNAGIIPIRLRMNIDSGGVEISDPPDEWIASALRYQCDETDPQDQVHISNNSWYRNLAWPLDGTTEPMKDPLDLGPTPLVENALIDGVTQGRGGRGIIYTFAAGNNRVNITPFPHVPPYIEYNDRVDYNGLASSRYTIAVGATDSRGIRVFYSEPGASLLVNAPSLYDLGYWAEPQTFNPPYLSIPNYEANGGGLTTTTEPVSGYASDPGDGRTWLIRDHPTDFYRNYSNYTGGTSNATPQVSGVVALMLQMNPNLGWRDVQHILVETAEKTDPYPDGTPDDQWITNGAGYEHNQNYGFGRVDAAAAVTRAASWVNAPSGVVIQGVYDPVTPLSLPDPSGGVTQPAQATVNLSADPGLFVEHVEVIMNVTHGSRGDLRIALQSPEGTWSLFQTEHDDPYDLSAPRNADYDDWMFTSVVNWGEGANGQWTLELEDQEDNDVGGQLEDFTVRVYGYLPTVEFAESDSALLESDGTARVRVVFSPLARRGNTVNYQITGITATAGLDYSGPYSGTLEFDQFATEAFIEIPIVDDPNEESSETFQITLSNPTRAGLGSQITHTVTIVDDDAPTLPDEIVLDDLDPHHALIVGEAPWVELGSSCVFGDVDGNGRDDLIIGRHVGPYSTAWPNTPQGDVLVIFDGTVNPGDTLDLHQSGFGNLLQILGDPQWSYAGWSVARGDFDLDNRDDVVIGSLYGDSDRVFIIYGGSGLAGNVIELETATSSVATAIIGPADTCFGHAVATGDIDSDGDDDLVISAYGADMQGGNNSGSIYVVHGPIPRATGSIDVTGTFNGFRIDGHEANLAFGWSLATGDVIRNGFDDIVIGAYAANPLGRVSAGEVIVFPGGNSWPSVVDLALDNEGETHFRGGSAGDNLGISVAAGDVDGDGTEEVIAGAYRADPLGRDRAGSVYVIDMDQIGGSYIDLSSPPTGVIQIHGAGAGNEAGIAVGAANVNGDAYDDVLVGAHYASHGGDSGCGITHVLNGSPTLGSVVDLAGAGADDVRIIGTNYIDYFGESIAAVEGDMDLDGFSDLSALASHGDLPPRDHHQNYGYAAVVFGRGDSLTGARTRISLSGSPPPADFDPVVRTVLSFSDGSNLSETTVTVTRSDQGISNLPPSAPDLSKVADVRWYIETDRANWSSATVMFQYTDAEVEGLVEADLCIYRAPSLSGPWTQLTTTLPDTVRNEVSATITSSQLPGYFAICETPLDPKG